MSVHITTSQNVDLDYEVASVGDRIVAQLLDYLVYIVWALAVFATSGLMQRYWGFSNDSSFFLIVMVAPIMLYPLLSEYLLNGQTLGKKLLKIRVVRIDGDKATLSDFLLRYVMIPVDVTFLSGLVALLTIIINGKGQRVGDIAAGTAVVKLSTKIHLKDVVFEMLPDNYQVLYTEVTLLTDRDMGIIRSALAKDNDEIEQITADKVASFLKIEYSGSPREFLAQIQNDHQYLATNVTITEQIDKNNGF